MVSPTYLAFQHLTYDLATSRIAGLLIGCIPQGRLPDDSFDAFDGDVFCVIADGLCSR